MKPIRQFTLIVLCTAFTPLPPAQTGDYKLNRDAARHETDVEHGFIQLKRL